MGASPGVLRTNIDAATTRHLRYLSGGVILPRNSQPLSETLRLCLFCSQNPIAKYLLLPNDAFDPANERGNTSDGADKACRDAHDDTNEDQHAAILQVPC